VVTRMLFLLSAPVYTLAMDVSYKSIIEKISALADQLPDGQRSALHELITSWQGDVRKASREPYSEVLTLSSGSASCHGQARDVSATGLFIETESQFEIGDRVKMMLTFISAPNPLRLSGTVVRKQANGIGVQFDERSQSQVNELDSIIAKHTLILRSR